MVRWGFPNKANDKASSIVDLPEPFDPTISVEVPGFRSTTISVSPALRKFLYVSVLNFTMIIVHPLSVPPRTVHEDGF